MRRMKKQLSESNEQVATLNQKIEKKFTSVAESYKEELDELDELTTLLKENNN